MITQFDHLTLATPYFEEHQELLRKLGFTNRFVAKDLRNPRVKRSLMKEFSESHDIALFDAPHSLSIELVRHSESHTWHSSIVPIFEKIPNPLISQSGVEDSTLPEPMTKVTLKGLEAPVYLKKKAAFGTCQSLVMNVRDKEPNVNIWKLLGAKVVIEAAGMTTLEFKSPLHSFPITLHIVEDSSVTTPVPLDSYGFNYVALISTSPKKEREHLQKAGIAATPLERHDVNQKNFDLFFITGPGVQPVEVLGLH